MKCPERLKTSDNLNFEPCYAKPGEIATINFATNQLLVICNLKNFDSSSPTLNIIVTASNRHKSLLVVIEVNLQDI